jgi:predicted phosphoribosyltransferase
VLWLRALLVHPVLFVAPWIALAQLFATGDDDDVVLMVGVAFWAVPLGGIAASLLTAVMIVRSGLPMRERAALGLIGLVGSGGMIVLGWVLWYQVAQYDCADRYECPF